ncbi:tRNA(Ile)-lysidine synthase [mine drainage metagenome]|uniref:tRNA(Ile)-lysidine synthetase n=1 Tax=mine drainage metagenome TaxID=410659 RepID=A0A1J5REX9_9ZZZZ
MRLSGEDAFAAAMAGLGPWEREPCLAIAVSGGRDSLALTLLADGWARARGGRALGLTVEHGLRPGSAAEARQVGDWLAGRGIAHHILPWRGDKPAHGVQAAARQARYALLGAFCAERGILHLLLAHHREDQAETLLARLARGSGVDGLAAMSPVTEGPDLRLVRPLLEWPRARLEQVLAAAEQTWAEDPSNRCDLYQRVRLRGLAPRLAAEGLTAARLSATAGRLGRARAALEAAAALLAARAVSLRPQGYALLDPAPLLAAPEEVGLRLLAALVRTVSGADGYPPRLERLRRLYAALAAGLTARRGFGGCLLAPAPGGLLVGREPARMAPPVVLDGGGGALWDGRFRMIGGVPGRTLGALGAADWARLRKDLKKIPLPAAICPTLPALRDQQGVCAVPHLGYNRMGGPEADAGGSQEGRMIFAPSRPLAGAFHCLVSGEDGIM